MNYSLEFRKFITSQYLYSGVRITTGVLIPALVLYYYDVLPTLIGIPLGALFCSTADNPGPPKHRRNGMLISIGINFILVLIGGYSRGYPWLIGIELVIAGIFFSLIAVYGNRANSIGLSALFVFALQLDNNQGAQHVLLQAVFFAIGGLWYAGLSLTTYTIRPYRFIQQLLGECLMETADYCKTRALFYSSNSDQQAIYSRLFHHQIRVLELQEEISTMLFSTRRFITESTNKSRTLMQIYLDTIDLFERITTAQQDYSLLHNEFDETGILRILKENIEKIAAVLHQLGLAVQSGDTFTPSIDLDAEINRTNEAFAILRKSRLNSSNVEAFISLRHILFSIQDLTDRLRRLQTYSSFDTKISKGINKEMEFDKFRSQTEISPALLISNISFKSISFRHAIRLTLALLIGYTIIQIFSLDHGYWILLTILTILKPAYGLSKERNIQRLLGTLIGIFAGFGFLSLNMNDNALLVIMVLAMIFAYSMLKIRYGIAIGAISFFLLLSFHFLQPMAIRDLLENRVLDTIIGCAIAYVCSLLVVPSWQREQISNLIKIALQNNKSYFYEASLFFTSGPSGATDYRVAIKDAFVALANLSHNFQAMLSEPKNQQKNMQHYHQFVTTNHTILSHIAALSSFAQKFGDKYKEADFEPMVKRILNQFERAIRVIETGEPLVIKKDESFPMNKKVQQLLEQRKRDLQISIEKTSDALRRTMSDLKAITDQFVLIHSILTEQIKILNELVKLKNSG